MWEPLHEYPSRFQCCRPHKFTMTTFIVRYSVFIHFCQWQLMSVHCVRKNRICNICPIFLFPFAPSFRRMTDPGNYWCQLSSQYSARTASLLNVDSFCCEVPRRHLQLKSLVYYTELELLLSFVHICPFLKNTAINRVSQLSQSPIFITWISNLSSSLLSKNIKINP